MKRLGLDDNTLVVFSSDHKFNAGHHGLWGKGNAAYPLNVFDTSLRIPMIWRHTGAIQPGAENSIVQVLDVAPTILEYAGNYSFPSTANTPGESFVDFSIPAKETPRPLGPYIVNCERSRACCRVSAVQ